MILSRHRVYLFLSIKHVETLWRICRYRAALNSARGIFTEFSSRIVGKKAIPCVSSGFGMCFFSAMKAELVHRGIAVLPGWVDASALQIEVPMKLKARSTSPTEISLKLFCFVQFTFPGAEALRAVEKQPHWNPFVNAGVATVDNCCIDNGIAQYTSTTRVVQDCLEGDSARVWDAKQKALLDFWLGWVAAVLSQDVAYDDKLWMSRPGGRPLLNRKRYASQCRHNNSDTVPPDRCPGFLMIATAEEEASFFACPGSLLFVFYTAAKKHELTHTVQKECVIISSFSVSIEYCRLQNAWAGWEESLCLRYYVYFCLSHVSLTDTISFANRTSFSVQPSEINHPKKTMVML